MTTASVEHFMRFCDDANIDHRQGGESLRKYLLSYQRNLNHKPAYEFLFGASFINWDYVQTSLPKMDCAHWLTLFRLLDFSKVPRDKSILLSIERNLLSMGLDARLTCPIFILRNMLHVTAKVGIERLMAEHGVPDAHMQSREFCANCADEVFEVNETTAIFCQVLRACEVREDELEQQMQFILSREKEATESFREKQSRLVGGRPRLRKKLKEIRPDADSLAGMGKYERWCQKVAFPAVFAKPMRDKLYFLMAQASGPQHAFVPAITRDVHVCRALENAPVDEPDPQVLHRTITSMKLIEEPFRELLIFKTECLGTLPLCQLGTLNYNSLVHLYVCAYQRPQVWTEIWKQIVPFLSHQVIRDVEAFTAKHPFNIAAVMRIMNGS